jgi:hypothetical protein
MTEKQVEINAILRENRSATRQELNELYLQAVCQTTCKNIVELMSIVELKRLLCICLMEFWILDRQYTQSYVVLITSRLVGVHRTYLYRLIKEYGIQITQEHGRENSRVSTEIRGRKGND